MLNGKTGKQIFNWLSGMVKDGLADQPGRRQQQLRQPRGNRQRQPRHGDRHQRAARDDFGPAGERRVSERRPLGVAPMPGLVTGKGGALRERRVALHHEQVVAREAGGRLAVREVPERPREPGGVGSGYRLHPDPQERGESTTVQDFWAQNPTYKVAHDQLLLAA